MHSICTCIFVHVKKLNFEHRVDGRWIYRFRSHDSDTHLENEYKFNSNGVWTVGTGENEHKI